jgi:transcriptional regulator with XRE-family HTH domain
MDIATRIDRLIQRAGLSNQAVADAVGVSDQTIARWREGDGKGPPLGQALRLVVKLGVSVEFLATGRDPLPSDLTDDERHILTLVRDLELTRAEATRRLMAQPAAERPSSPSVGVGLEVGRHYKPPPQPRGRQARTKGPKGSKDHESSEANGDRSQS